jgi:hypothetical protein
VAGVAGGPVGHAPEADGGPAGPTRRPVVGGPGRGAVAAWSGPFCVAVFVLLNREPWNWGRALVFRVLYGAGMAVRQIWRERRAGTFRDRLAVRRSIAVGALPSRAADLDGPVTRRCQTPALDRRQP